jgi:hypothetical protein
MRTVSVVGSGGVAVGDLAALRAERRDMGQDTQFGGLKVRGRNRSQVWESRQAAKKVRHRSN